MGNKKREKVAKESPLSIYEIPKVCITKRETFCVFCAEQCDDENFESHRESHSHQANVLKACLIATRTDLQADKYGVTVAFEIDDIKEDKNGNIPITVGVGAEKTFKLQIKNASARPVRLCYCEFLRDMKVAKLSDELHVAGQLGNCQKQRRLDFEPGEDYTIDVTFQSIYVNTYQIPLALKFKLVETGVPFFIVRYLMVLFNSPLLKKLEPEKIFQRRKKRPQHFSDVSRTVPGYPIPKEPAAFQLKPELPLDWYEISEDLLEVCEKQAWNRHSSLKHLSPTALMLVDIIISLFDEGLTEDNYQKYLALLLHIEEHQMYIDIQHYDMENARLKTIPENSRLLSLNVPGLIENRPSVMKGDRIYVQLVTDDKSKPRLNGPRKSNVEFEGIVHHVHSTSLHLGFGEPFMKMFIPNMRFFVRFTFSRLSLRMQHRALEYMVEGHKALLYPNCFLASSCPPLTNPFRDELVPFKRSILDNKEQCQAVLHILIGSSRPIPYLLFGPPGTGKTMTLVEAIKQIWHHYKNAHILVCAPSNSACDTITDRLLEHIPASQMFRMNAAARDPNKIPESVRKCSNYDKDLKSFCFPEKKEIMKYRVVITTLISSGRLVSAAFPTSHFTHIFIDEAGQSMEPESLVPIIGLLSSCPGKANSLGGQLVLAGDPKQLGPILRSEVASGRASIMNYGLATSMLERLMMEDNRPYVRDNNNQYNPKVMMKLVQNYRNHPAILRLPNDLFYDGELQACSNELVSSMCNWEGLPNKGFPLIFRGVMGRDMQESHSPSFFNPEEVHTVIDYVDALLSTKRNGIRIQQKDIGIISPYRKQVEKIRWCLKEKDFSSVNVGSTEEFQGQERRVIIISTVRSKADMLAMDFQFKLGFLKNPKRFNVAITRAKALLIVIGNPYILVKDEHWGSLLQYCIDHGAYVGCHYDGPEMAAEDIVNRFDALKLVDDSEIKSVEQELFLSLQEEQEEPAWPSNE